MKLTLFDAGSSDCTVQRQIIEHLPAGYEPNSDVNVAVVAYTPNFKFIESFRDIAKRPYVIFDYLEFGWTWGGQSENRLGHGSLRSFDHLDSDEWQKLDDFIRENPPALTFKRDLLSEHVTETMLPIEWLCEEPIPPVQSKEQFDARPIEVLHAWGYSNPSRVHLHADIFRAMTEHGIEVISEPRHFRELKNKGLSPERLWASIYTPWFARYPVSELFGLQRLSKVTTSLPGAGWKCFRHSQSPVGSIMALPEDHLAWSYPWEDQENCIRMDGNQDALYLMDSTGEFMSDGLYPIYLAGQDNIRKYECARYCHNYLLPNIERIL